jgi:hypothetical protein
MDIRSDFEKLQACLSEIGVDFRLTDDSEESDINEDLDTVIVIEHDPYRHVLFLFRRDGSFKDICVI